MELLKNFENICRVCGGGIQSKKQEQHSAIYCIFTTLNLKDNLEKYLLLEIKENDSLPRFICSFCFKKINSIIEFANSAKNFENFLKQFLTMQVKQPQLTLQYPHLSKKLNNFQDSYKSHIQERPLWTENESPPRKNTVDLITGDVVVNVSPTDPISRDKLVQAKKRHSGGFVNPKRHLTKHLKEVRFIKKPPPMIVNPATLPKVATSMVGPVSTESSGPPITVCNFAKEALPTLADFHTVNDCLNLGSVIKDKDLLKLILKALKWPYDKHTLNAQIQRLKCTRFRDIMVDPLLLQDTDLIQILTQYFGPNFKFQQSSPPPGETPRKSPPPLQPILPQSLAYKLPAETSIQVINVPKKIATQKKRRKPLKTTDVIVLSDDENDSNRKPESMEINVDPMMYFGENSNSDEKKLPKKKHISADRKPRRRKQSLTSIQSRNNGVEDLVIMGQMSPTSGGSIASPTLTRPQHHITYKKKTKLKATEIVTNLNDYDDENPLVIDDSSIDIWENVKIDESAAINQVDHLIGETTKIVEIEMPQKTLVDEDSTNLVATPAEVTKELLLPPADVLIKDSLKFDDSEGEEVDVLGFELLQTDDSEKEVGKVVIVEEKVQTEEKEEEPEEPKKEKNDTEEEWPSVPKRRRLLKPERSKEKEEKVEEQVSPPKSHPSIEKDESENDEQSKVRSKEIKKTTLETVVSVSHSRPARKSKTFSKYYKDPSSTESPQPAVRISARATKGTSRRK